MANLAAAHIHITQEPVTVLPEYATVSIAFVVESRYVFEVLQSGLGGWRLIEAPVERPYIKDYDAIRGEGPLLWAYRWDISQWGVLSAFDGPKRVGGAVVAYNTPRVNLLEGRSDIAALWDIRVHPDYRRKGIGSQLFARAVAWARQRHCKTLKVETQNINVPACKFYARHGCELRAIHPNAYPSFPDEVQLLWYLDL